MQPCIQASGLSNCPHLKVNSVVNKCARTATDCTDTTADEDGPHQRDEGLRLTGQYYNCMLPTQQSQMHCQDAF